MIAGIDLGGTQMRVALARSDGQILGSARTRTPLLEASPSVKPARRHRLRRARLGDRAGQVGAVEWARANL